jgi:hypothetical protein
MTFQPTLMQFGDTGLATSTLTPVKVTQSIIVSCSKPGYVTNEFRTLTVTCGYDGTFNLPDMLSTCRAGTACPASPVPDAATNLVAVTPASPINEFQFQVFNSFL